MSPSTQAKALRLLQEQQFERVGGNTTIQTDVRIIAATNKDLGALAAAGQFRQDLFYRLNGFTVSLPPLRERKEDIPILAEHFRKRFNRDLGRNVISITADALAALEAHDWPGNVRELQSAIKYAMVQAAGDVITPDCLPESCLRPTISVATCSAGSSDAPPSLGSSDLQRLVQQHLADGTPDLYRHLTSVFDRIILSEVMQQVRGNQVQAADRLGISRMTLRNKLRNLGLLPGTEDFED